jgi:type II secretory pathway component PulF
MAGLVVLGFVNLAFLGLIQIVYGTTMKRRAKVFTLVEHLAEMAERALPLATGLRMLATDLGGVFGNRVGRVARRMEDGASLADALEAVPGAFPPLVRSLAAQGERCGNLAAFLRELRRLYARMVEAPGRSVYQFFYPVLITICVNAVLLALFIGILPKFYEILRALKTSQNHLDHYVVWFERVLWANQATLLSSVVIVLLLFLGAGSSRFGSSTFRFLGSLLDPLVLALPVFGRVVRDGALGRWALGSGLFLRAGATLPEALRAAADAEPNRILAGRFRKLAAAAAEGRRLSEAGRALGVLPTDLLWFVEAGEAAGALPDYLVQAAGHYDTKSVFAAEVAGRSVVPLFVLLNGLLVLAVGVLMFLPISQMYKILTPV